MAAALHGKFDGAFAEGFVYGVEHRGDFVLALGRFGVFKKRVHYAFVRHYF